MKLVEWQTEVPARLQEFRAILREAQEFYTAFPHSPAETRIYIQEDGRVGGRRMTGRFETPVSAGLNWPVCDLAAAYPLGRGWMSTPLDGAFANAVRMRAEYFNFRAQQRLGGAA